MFGDHFCNSGLETITNIVATSLVLFSTARASPGAIKQESSGSSVTLPIIHHYRQTAAHNEIDLFGLRSRSQRSSSWKKVRQAASKISCFAFRAALKLNCGHRVVKFGLVSLCFANPRHVHFRAPRSIAIRLIWDL